jgi:hypothetical protein
MKAIWVVGEMVLGKVNVYVYLVYVVGSVLDIYICVGGD